MNKLISIKEACRITSLSRTTLWKMVNAGQFPKPVSLGCDRKAFLESEIQAWIKNLATKRSDRDGA